MLRLNSKTVGGLAVVALLAVDTALADGGARADGHAPIGVMGDHTHHGGEWMVSYRAMQMEMSGNREGTDSIGVQQIATTVANRFAGLPMQPPTLRVVPTRMTMTMHMLGLMYAPTDRVTLMAMLNAVDNEMDHTTFAGGMGTDILGGFTTGSDGLGDSQLIALIRLDAPQGRALHATVGLSVPTGDVTETDEVLTPMNMRPMLRLPYPMQIGSGSYDPIVGLTYRVAAGEFGWGTQWRSTLRISDNDEDYRLGDQHQLTGWLSYSPKPSLSWSGRLTLTDTGKVEGIDPQIVAPVQTADPDRQGYTKLDFAVGANTVIAGHRIGGEFAVPLYQNLNGPQLETDWQITVGYQYAF